LERHVDSGASSGQTLEEGDHVLFFKTNLIQRTMNEVAIEFDSGL